MTRDSYRGRVYETRVCPSVRPQMATMQERFGISGAVISAVDLIMGLGTALQEMAKAFWELYKKGYFDVRTLSASPELTALSLLSAGSPHDEFGWPQGYAFDAATIAEMARQNVVDAVLLVVFSGEQVEETRRSRTKIESLRTVYSEVLATAAVIDRNGQELWQLAGNDSFRALVLQYADFDEAYYNRTNTVQVKNISMAGIERVLDEPQGQEGVSMLPEMYADLFAEISSGISPSLLDSLR